MKAAIYHSPLKVTTEDVDKPTIGPDGILMRVRSCGICGSDLHMYKLGLFTDSLCRKSDGGLIPGHEFSGDVVEVGDKVQGLAVGDRVVAFANGGMAEYVPITPAWLGMNVHKVPESVPYNIAATLEPLANSVHAVLKGNPAKGETAMVFGAGIIGLGVVQCLKALDLGIKKIIAVDVSEKRLEMARTVGADDTINASTDDVMEMARDLAGTVPAGFGSEIEVPAVDIVYDCVGLIKDRPEPPVLQQAINVVRPGSGRVVVHGVFEAPVTLELTTFVAKQTQIIGSFAMTPEDTVKAIELLDTKAVDREVLISHEFPLDQAKEAFDAQVGVDTSIKVLLDV
jgi:threonine dehydrogenase-like Zn-dependent dehydrogenase